MGKNQFAWGAYINYAPNTEYITKNEGYVIRNVDGSGVDQMLKEQGFTDVVKDKKVKEKVLAILN